MSIDDKVEIIGDSLHDIRGAIEGAGVRGLGNITTYADAIEVLGGGQRRIGEIITSTIPLTDAGVHLLDGSLIGGGEVIVALLIILLTYTTPLLINTLM